MGVVVERGLGDKPGPSIVEPILTSESAQEERGRQEINQNDSDRVIESGNLIGSTFRRPGLMVQASEAQSTYKAMITTFAFTITNTPDFSITAAIQMERIK